MPDTAHNFAIRRFQCRHIFTDGHRCGSPSLRGEDFCYYHHATHRAQRAAQTHDPYNNPPNETSFTLPIPEDFSSIQHAVGAIMNRLASNSLDPRRAGLLLYALQIASGNLHAKPRHKAGDIVHDITLDPAEGPLAPQNELPEDVADRKFREEIANIPYDDEDDDLDDEDDDLEEDDNDTVGGDDPAEGEENIEPEAEEQKEADLQDAIKAYRRLFLDAGVAPVPETGVPGRYVTQAEGIL